MLGGIGREMIYQVYQYTLFTVVAIVVYSIVTDPNASLYIVLQTNTIWINIRRLFLMAKMKPRLMYDMWRMRRMVKKIKKIKE